MIPAPVQPVTTTPPAKCCHNCGHELHGEFCSHCGQEHIEENVPAGEMLREFLKDEFHFDYRIVRTILPLLFRPGFLTQEYIAGRRVRYVPPLRTYVFISIILFALVAIGAKNGSLKVLDIGHHTDGTDSGATVKKPRKSTRWTINFGVDSTVVQADAAMPSEAVRESLAAALEREKPDKTKGGIYTRMREGLVAAFRDPDRFIETAVEHSAQAMFLVMPLVALLLKMLYLRRKRGYIEHLVFTLHVHAFTFFILAFAAAAALTGWHPLLAMAGWLLWSIPVYLLLAMKRVYGQGWRKTLVKLWLLGTGYIFLLFPALAAVLMVSILWR